MISQSNEYPHDIFAIMFIVPENIYFDIHHDSKVILSMLERFLILCYVAVISVNVEGP